MYGYKMMINMLNKSSIIVKFLCIYFLLASSILLTVSVQIYFIQEKDYNRNVMENIEHIAAYLDSLIKIDSEEFLCMQNFLVNNIDEFVIPRDFDGNYKSIKIKFDKKFTELYQNKVFNLDVFFDDLPQSMKILYTEYVFLKWLTIFENAEKKIDVKYVYYLVPTGEKYHMYWVLDFHRGKSKYYGQDYINICPDVYQPPNEHKKMWEAWNTSTNLVGYDLYDNKYGKTYAFYSPLIIDNKKYGLIGIEVEIDSVTSSIFYNALNTILPVCAIILFLMIFMLFIIYKKYLLRIKALQLLVDKYKNQKDVRIANEIENSLPGNDELSDLAKQISTMIYEIDNYMYYFSKAMKALFFERERAEIMDRLAREDSLTGIHNKTAYDLAIKELNSVLKEKDVKFAIAVIDLNYLKRVNDNYGHECGNVTIKKLCEIIKSVFDSSCIYRVGGDEFCVIIRDNNLDLVDELIFKFNNNIYESSSNQNLKPWEKVSAAIGVAFFDKKVDVNAESVFNRADAEMYRCKKKMKQNEKYDA